FSEITQGLTPLPSELALGATWRPENAELVGQILGSELSRLGINVVFGPVLDVMDTPKPGTPGDIGVRVFGGDPYWVGKFGAAFTRGVQDGSAGRIAVVAKHFPGLGSSDRNVEDEIPTVQKSLEQLKQIELAPFFAVTQAGDREPSSQGGIVDGLLVSHIRYRGFQGNIRASTRPVSLDPLAYQALMSLPEIAPWRAAGGVTFSDALGARGVRRFYDPLDLSFNARRVAQEAFVAGNDVLVLGSFGLSNSWPEQLANIKDTIQFFRERYVSDQTFAARVDAALVRILSLKLKLYAGNFSPGTAQVDIEAARTIVPYNEAMAAIAKESVTLLSPGARDLPAVLGPSLRRDEHIVFVTDDRQIKECPRCNPYPAIPPTALQDIALALYGPRATGQVDPARMSSFTFNDLANFRKPAVETSSQEPTATHTPEATPSITETSPLTSTDTILSPKISIDEAIEQADLIVFAMLDLNTQAPSTVLFRDFLAQRADVLRDKRVVALAFGAPYYLDATEISKLTAYFAVYSRTPAFLEAAIRVLFGELPPAGALPVSITALNYSLLVQTSPDPNQVIPLTAGNVITAGQTTPAPLELKVGNSLQLRAGPIYDRNGHIVPDGTPVQFVLAYPVERVEQQQAPVSTRDGIAETTVVIERKGQLEIRAIAEPAQSSYVIKVNIGDDASSIETIRPTPMPTPTPEPTATPTPAPTVAPTMSPELGNDQVTRNAMPERTSPQGFVLTLFALLTTGLSAAVALAAVTSINLTQRWRIVLWSWSAGWGMYVLYVAGAPGMETIATVFGWLGGALISAGASLTALTAALIFSRRQKTSSAS
ncbi:MAG: glycoside hydrolase family 3 N-terminal domain-containing protein, partial [Anaerolineae bacterium]|nr:hypothetical protein [Thermoflexales bacterium]MDW8408196.1 glycoside hydrolase family 3 N-terminal domain-containing protein [Anaerolineae bacterium]